VVQTTLQNEKTDEELFEQFRSGNGEGFEKLVHRYEGELFGYLNRYLHNRSQAEDVFQNCFMQVYQKAGLFEKGKTFRPWLYSIATHLAIDETRRSKRRTTLSLDKSSSQDPGEGKNNLLEGLESSENRPDRLAMEEEKKEQVRKVVDSLPEQFRQVLILAYFQELKYQEISEVLEIPLGTVKSRLHSAIERFQEAWAKLQVENEKGFSNG